MQTEIQSRLETAPDFPAGLFSDDLKEKRPARVTISRSPEEIFRFLRNADHYARFLDQDADIEIKNSKPDLIVWRAGEEGFGAFALRPAPGGRGTIVTFKMSFEGEWTGTIARMVGRDSDTRAAVALRKLKAYLETGEVPTTEGQPSGREEVRTH